MAITTVFPVPVAILKAVRGKSGFEELKWTPILGPVD